MTELAPMSAVLKKEYESEMQASVPAGQYVTIFYDTGFPLEPDIESLVTDQDGLTIQEVVKLKDRLKVKFNQQFNQGQKLNLKIKPKRMI